MSLSGTDFFYKNTDVCTNTNVSTIMTCQDNKNAGLAYLDMKEKLSAIQTKKDDINRLYVRELIYTGNMVIGVIALMLYIKYNK